MRLLLDTHVLLALINEQPGSLGREVEDAVTDESNSLWASVVSVWEIAIKWRLGKLRLRMPLQGVPETLENLGLSVLEITAGHAIADVEPEPGTRDPFDRLLLAQCGVEGLRLVTIDRALVGHPMAWRA